MGSIPYNTTVLFFYFLSASESFSSCAGLVNLHSPADSGDGVNHDVVSVVDLLNVEIEGLGLDSLMDSGSFLIASSPSFLWNHF